MIVAFKQLPNGYVQIIGNGPHEWAQVPIWPCMRGELEAGFSREASETFRDAAREELRKAVEGKP